MADGFAEVIGQHVGHKRHLTQAGNDGAQLRLRYDSLKLERDRAAFRNGLKQFVVGASDPNGVRFIMEFVQSQSWEWREQFGALVRACDSLCGVHA
jgi:hypothetical protein